MKFARFSVEEQIYTGVLENEQFQVIDGCMFGDGHIQEKVLH